MELFEDGYHLASPRTAPEPPSLDGARLLLLEKGHCLQRHALRAFPEAGLAADESFAATSLGTLSAMVSEGLGITLLPDLAVAAGAAAESGVALTPLPDACPRTVVLVWRPTSPRASVFREIGEILRDARPCAEATG
jgi:LysR family hydrogen peroxide-inducible transcriptional activator